MYARRFGRKLKLPSTISIKNEIRKLMIEELTNELAVLQRAEKRADLVTQAMSSAANDRH
jgi:hypothetical protein